ncbi:MAG TPA: hypothetical protein VGK30_21270 [Candidatus Binatia bacterium]
MRTMTTWQTMALAMALVALPRYAGAYPNGTGEYVTDAGPFCAGCHSSRQESQFRELPKEHAAQQLVDNKHLALITKGTGPYQSLSDADRAALVEQLRAVDTASTVTIEVPKSVKPGASVTATVKVKGGAGPVVGVMLLDSDLRYQSRTPAADGWMITAAPAVTGPDGKPQTTWTDKRAAGLGKNINYVMVYGMKGDAVAKTFSSATVAYTLTAPTKPGDYTLAAALLYGTEKASPLSTVKKTGFDLPMGGFAGASGRILFTDAQKVTVTP